MKTITLKRPKTSKSFFITKTNSTTMVKAELQVGPISPDLVIGDPTKHTLRIYSEEFIPPLWFMIMDTLTPRGEEPDKLSFEINANKLVELIDKPYRVFEDDPYLKAYVKLLDHIKEEILGIRFRKEKLFISIPVTITIIDAVKTEEEKQELLATFQTVWDLIDDVLGNRITTKEFIEQFNEITAQWTKDFKFTGDLQKDVQMVGEAKNLVIRTLGTIQDNPALEFRTYSTILAYLP